MTGLIDDDGLKRNLSEYNINHLDDDFLRDGFISSIVSAELQECRSRLFNTNFDINYNTKDNDIDSFEIKKLLEMNELAFYKVIEQSLACANDFVMSDVFMSVTFNTDLQRVEYAINPAFNQNRVRRWRRKSRKLVVQHIQWLSRDYDYLEI